jgi:hypothetical protein
MSSDMKQTIKLLQQFGYVMLIASAFALSGCGGGGGGGGTTTTPPNPTPASSNWDQLNWDKDNWG